MTDIPFQVPWRELWPPTCPDCGYCWTGLTTPRCPECGFALPEGDLLLFGIHRDMMRAGPGSLWSIIPLTTAFLIIDAIETYRGWVPGMLPMLNGLFAFILLALLLGRYIPRVHAECIALTPAGFRFTTSGKSPLHRWNPAQHVAIGASNDQWRFRCFTTWRNVPLRTFFDFSIHCSPAQAAGIVERLEAWTGAPVQGRERLPPLEVTSSST